MIFIAIFTIIINLIISDNKQSGKYSWAKIEI